MSLLLNTKKDTLISNSQRSAKKTTPNEEYFQSTLDKIASTQPKTKFFAVTSLTGFVKINGINRKIKASLVKSNRKFMGSYLVYKDTTTAWFVDAEKGNGTLNSYDWKKGSYVFKALERQIQKDEGKKHDKMTATTTKPINISQLKIAEDKNPFNQMGMGVAVSLSGNTIELLGKILRKSGVVNIKDLGQELVNVHDTIKEAAMNDGMNPNGTAAKIGNVTGELTSLALGGGVIVKGLSKLPIIAKGVKLAVPILAKPGVLKTAKILNVAYYGAETTKGFQSLHNNDRAGAVEHFGWATLGGLSAFSGALTKTSTGLRAIKMHQDQRSINEKILKVNSFIKLLNTEHTVWFDKSLGYLYEMQKIGMSADELVHATNGLKGLRISTLSREYQGIASAYKVSLEKNISFVYINSLRLNLRKKKVMISSYDDVLRMIDLSKKLKN